MTTRPTHRSVAALTLAALWCSVPVSASANEDVVVYTVRPGDTCWTIAKKLYDDPWMYKQIRSGKRACPDRLEPGQILSLPKGKSEAAREEDDHDAEIDAMRGAVDSRSPSESSWSRATLSQKLWRAWSVNAGDRASAQVRFTSSGARIELRENTLVVIYGPRTSEVRKAPGRAVLERGSLGARLGELSGTSPSLEVETPSATASMADGDAVVSVDDSEATLVSNHTSSGVTVRGSDRKKKARKKTRRRKKKVVVAENMGSKIEPGKDPSTPKPLPSSPTVTRDRARVLDAGLGASVDFEWDAVPSAATYVVQLSRRTEGGEATPHDVIEAPPEVTRVRFDDLPEGTYTATVSARDSEGFESKPSAPTEIVVEVPSEFERVIAGDPIDLPEGVSCTGSDGASSTTLAFDAAGEYELTCLDQATRTTSSVTLTVLAPAVPELEPRAQTTSVRASAPRAVDIGRTVARPGAAASSTKRLDARSSFSIGTYAMGGAPLFGAASLELDMRLGARAVMMPGRRLGAHAELDVGEALGGRGALLTTRFGAEYYLTVGTVRPFIRASLGATVWSTGDVPEHLHGSLGGGARVMLGKGRELRVDVMQEAASMPGQQWAWPLRASMGLAWGF